MLRGEYGSVDINTKYLPILVNQKIVERTFELAREKNPNFPLLAVVTGTKPDFYKQAPLIMEAAKAGFPAFVIDTGQHHDEILGHGIREFGMEEMVACNLQIRGTLMEKASELLLKFASFGKICKNNYPHNPILPIVHGDTLVAGITPLSWLFGMGQKVAQNEAGLRSMAPRAVKGLSLEEPSQVQIEEFVNSQMEEVLWFIARDEPFPEQVDTWICSAGTHYFFAPTQVNAQNLIREGYPEENIYVVGNSVVDAIDIKRKAKPDSSIFDLYPALNTHGSNSTGRASTLVRDEWIRVDIHRRENLTKFRFLNIIEAVVRLVETGYKVVLIRLTATEHALKAYGLVDRLNQLAKDFPDRFIQTPLWKDYGHVIEFLDSGSCWLELTDSGSMQEELLYFPNVISITVRLNTDRPETIFDARDNILAPPLHPRWITELVNFANQGRLPSSHSSSNKKQIYGEPGSVSTRILEIIKKHFEEGSTFYPWLHDRLGIDTGRHSRDEVGYL